MLADKKVYDKNGVLLNIGDRLSDGYTTHNWLSIYWGELYISGNKDIWKLEQFSLDAYNDGYKLIDFEKVGE